MNATDAAPENVVPLATDLATVVPAPIKKKAAEKASRFKVQEFINRSGSRSWRVTGIKRDKTRIRENFTDAEKAQARQLDLESEYLCGRVEERLVKTKLTEDQNKLAELAVLRLGDDWAKLVDAVDYWIRNGRQTLNPDAPRIDEAVEKYLAWLAGSPLRDATKRHWRTRMTVFRNSVPNLRVSDITPDTIDAFLAKRKVSASGKDTDRRAISRFFSWCIERPRKWTATNPCREVKVELGESKPPAILSLDECKRLLQAAEAHKGGKMVPYVALCLFGGLRPAEPKRIGWEAINLKDREIRIGSDQVKTGRKTGRGRVVEIDDTLHAWLKRYEGQPVYPSNWRKEFKAVRNRAGFGTPKDRVKSPELKEWVDDVMRHTAISHYVRQTGSYGKATEQFGPEEKIIKAHYQARVSTEEMKAFYALRPGKKAQAGKGGAK